MVVKKSQLAPFTLDCIRAVQDARAAALSEGIQTEPFEMSFTVQVIDDTQPAIEVNVTEQEQPEGKQTTTKGSSKTIQTQDNPEKVSTETQENAASQDQTTQVFGRSSRTTVDVTT